MRIKQQRENINNPTEFYMFRNLCVSDMKVCKMAKVEQKHVQYDIKYVQN